MPKEYRLVLLLLSILLFSQCSPCYYTPNAHNVPLFKEKNTAIVNGSYQFGEYSGGLNVQAAYAFANHFGVILNYNHFAGNYDYRVGSNVTNTNFKGNLIEIGAGYFLPFKKNFVFETYGGIGWGGVVNSHSSSTLNFNSDYKLNYNRYFLQAALGWQPIKILTIALSSRFCLLDYKNLNIQLGDSTDISNEVKLDANPSFLIEPAITVRIGGKVLSFQVQTVYSYNITNPDALVDPLGVNLGLFFSINGRKN